MNKLCQRLANSEQFQNFIFFLIFLTAVSMGFETVPEFADAYHEVFLILHYSTQLIFGIEICVRLIAVAPNVRIFFNSFWNTFDFFIVTVSFLPGIGSFALVARLLRVLRVLRIFSASDHLRGFVERLKDSFDEIVYASIIIVVLSYIFAISGHYLFFEIDAVHWGTLRSSIVSVFYLFLFQEVSSLVSPVVQVSIAYLGFFIAFYFAIVSLFICVISASFVQALKGECD